jgi:hypothetical protein
MYMICIYVHISWMDVCIYVYLNMYMYICVYICMYMYICRFEVHLH